MNAATTASTITYQGETWTMVAKFTEDNGSTAYALHRVCTGHWAADGRWVGARHRIDTCITAEQYQHAIDRETRLRAAGEW